VFAERDLGAVLYYESGTCVGRRKGRGTLAIEGKDVGILALVKSVVKRCDF